jgi:hypothetical protein
MQAQLPFVELITISLPKRTQKIRCNFQGEPALCRQPPLLTRVMANSNGRLQQTQAIESALPPQGVSMQKNVKAFSAKGRASAAIPTPQDIEPLRKKPTYFGKISEKRRTAV